MEKFNNMWDQMDNVSREMETLRKNRKEMQEKKNSTKAFDGFIRFLTAEEIRVNLKEAQ